MTGPVQPTPLLAALERLRLDGAIFFRAEFTESWALHSPVRDMTGVIRPGADRLILFHIVAAGRCWVEVEGGERHWAGRGDVIVLPYGDDYVMGGVGPAERVPLVTLMARPPWETMPVLVHGAGGARTDVVCGYLYSEDPLFDPNLRAFPPAFVVTLPDGPATDHGWVAALRDPVLAPAMAAVHAHPEQKWTVADLAAAVSRAGPLLQNSTNRRSRPVWSSSVASGAGVPGGSGLPSLSCGPAVHRASHSASAAVISSWVGSMVRFSLSLVAVESPCLSRSRALTLTQAPASLTGTRHFAHRHPARLSAKFFLADPG